MRALVVSLLLVATTVGISCKSKEAKEEEKMQMERIENTDSLLRDKQTNDFLEEEGDGKEGGENTMKDNPKPTDKSMPGDSQEVEKKK